MAQFSWKRLGHREARIRRNSPTRHDTDGRSRDRLKHLVRATAVSSRSPR
jgi:hypothetical protein